MISSKVSHTNSYSSFQLDNRNGLIPMHQRQARRRMQNTDKKVLNQAKMKITKLNKYLKHTQVELRPEEDDPSPRVEDRATQLHRTAHQIVAPPGT